MALLIDDIAIRRVPAPNSRFPRRLQGGRYDVERVVHITGARALLWGYQPELDRRVLIERVVGAREAQVRQALAGRETVLTLEHPHLARCAEIFVEDGALYLVLVTGAGQTLAEAAGAVTAPAEVIAAGINICAALNFARRQTKLHQDIVIDPFTAFQTRGGRTKLTGMASLLGVAAPRYRSRFAGSGGTAASRTAFSIGATLHFLLTGWQGSYRDGAPPLALLHPDLAAECSATIMRAIHPDPAQRWTDSAAFRLALLPLLG